MKNYIICLLAASVISAICTSVVTGGFEKYIRYVCSLICIIAIIAPIAAVTAGGIPKDIYEYTENAAIEVDCSAAAQAVPAAADNSVREYINGVIFDEFGITPADISIEIYSGNGELTVGSITVILSPQDRGYAEEASAYLAEMLGDTAEVVVSGG